MAMATATKTFANPTTGRTSCFAAASSILALITLNLRLGVFVIGLVSLVCLLSLAIILALVRRTRKTEPLF